MIRVSGQATNREWASWLIRTAAFSFLVSFFLPAIRFGSPGKTYVGLVASLLPLALLPFSLVELLPVLVGSSQSVSGLMDAGMRVFVGAYFWILLAQNIWMIVSLLLIRSSSPTRPPIVIERCAIAATVLAWGIPLVNYHRVLGPLGWSGPHVIEPVIGYYCWAASFPLLALGIYFTRLSASRTVL